MRLINLLCISLVLSACSTMVNTDYDKQTNFKALKTFAIQPKAIRVTDDTRINSPFMQQRVVAAIESALVNKGFSKAKQSADIKVKYYLDIKQDLETDESGVSVGIGTYSSHSAFGFGFSTPVAASVDKLVVTIDMYSDKSDKLIWRGSLAYRLVSGSTPEKNTELMNDLVAEIIKEFPPK